MQTNVWGRYHITDAQSFYEQTNGWSVAQDPGTLVTAAGAATTPITNLNGQVIRPKESRIDPYYLLMRLPGDTKESFVLLRSFVPTSDDDSKKKLTAFMVAKSDPEDYGKLITYEMPSDLQIDGPALVNSAIQANTSISAQISLLNQNGSTVAFGNLLLIPIDNSILYVRPLYVSSNNTPVPALKDVIVVWNGQSAMKPTLKEALQALFPGVKAETFEGVVGRRPRPRRRTEPDERRPRRRRARPRRRRGSRATTADQLIAEAAAAAAEGAGRPQDELRHRGVRPQRLPTGGQGRQRHAGAGDAAAGWEHDHDHHRPADVGLGSSWSAGRPLLSSSLRRGVEQSGSSSGS